MAASIFPVTDLHGPARIHNYSKTKKVPTSSSSLPSILAHPKKQSAATYNSLAQKERTDVIGSRSLLIPSVTNRTCQLSAPSVNSVHNIPLTNTTSLGFGFSNSVALAPTVQYSSSISNSACYSYNPVPKIQAGVISSSTSNAKYFSACMPTTDIGPVCITVPREQTTHTEDKDVSKEQSAGTSDDSGLYYLVPLKQKDPFIYFHDGTSLDTQVPQRHATTKEEKLSRLATTPITMELNFKANTNKNGGTSDQLSIPANQFPASNLSTESNLIGIELVDPLPIPANQFPASNLSTESNLIGIELVDPLPTEKKQTVSTSYAECQTDVAHASVPTLIAKKKKMIAHLNRGNKALHLGVSGLGRKLGLAKRMLNKYKTILEGAQTILGIEPVPIESDDSDLGF